MHTHTHTQNVAHTNGNHVLAFSVAKPAGRTSHSRVRVGGASGADAAIGKQISFTDDETISTRAKRDKERDTPREREGTLQNLCNTCVATSASPKKEIQHASEQESEIERENGRAGEKGRGREREGEWVKASSLLIVEGSLNMQIVPK